MNSFQKELKTGEDENVTGTERSLLKALDMLLQSAQLRARIQPGVERVREKLAHQKEHVLMTWEPIPLTTYGDRLPAEIQSSWIFVLRGGADTGAERHPNSHQRMMSFQGTGDMRIGKRGSDSRGKADDAEAKMVWESNILVSEPDAPWHRRWISIPPKVWHRPVVGSGGDWVVVSFHTVPAEELIEERPNRDGKAGTRQMRYLGARLKR